jgi:hypothetical protein
MRAKCLAMHTEICGKWGVHFAKERWGTDKANDYRKVLQSSSFLR